MSDEVSMFLMVFIPLIVVVVGTLLIYRRVLSKRFIALADLLNGENPTTDFEVDLPTIGGTPSVVGAIHGIDVRVFLQMKGGQKREWQLAYTLCKGMDTQSFEYSQNVLFVTAAVIHQDILEKIQVFGRTE